MIFPDTMHYFYSATPACLQKVLLEVNKGNLAIKVMNYKN